MKLVPVLQRDHQHFNKAMIAASLSSYSIRVGCVAAKGNKVICAAVNKQRNITKNVNYWESTYHAEMACLHLTPTADLAKVTLYIARLDKMGRVRPSRPCDRCMIRFENEWWADVREIVYLDRITRKIVKEVIVR